MKFLLDTQAEFECYLATAMALRTNIEKLFTSFFLGLSHFLKSTLKLIGILILYYLIIIIIFFCIIKESWSTFHNPMDDELASFTIEAAGIFYSIFYAVFWKAIHNKKKINK